MRLKHVGNFQDGDVELAVLVYVVERTEDMQGILLRHAVRVVVRLKILYQSRGLRGDSTCDLGNRILFFKRIGKLIF